MSLKKLFAAFAKFDELDDGTLKVYGYASSESEDSEGETITSDAMKAALPDYMKFGAVREMHQASAAGTAIEAQVEADGRTYFAAHVVDPIAVKKVQTKTYKGFSIGGKVTKRDADDKKKITGLKLVEVSLVDRPANPDAVFTMYKAEGLEEETPVAPTPEEEAAAAKEAAKVAHRATLDAIGKMIDDKSLTLAELLEAGTAAVAKKAAPDPVVKRSKGDDLKKGIGAMCQFASLLQSISWLASDTAYETAYEQDGSTVPAQLRDWLRAGVEIFAAMSAEEIAEMLAQIQPVEVTVVTAAEPTGDLAKAGAKFSKKTKAALKAAHDACKAADAALADLGYEKADEVEEAAAPGEVQKAAVTPPVAESTEGDLLKAALTGTDALKAELAEITKRLKVVESQPLPAKGVTKVIAKGHDTGAVDEPNEPEIPVNATPEQRAHHEMQKVFRTGGVKLMS